MRSALNVAFRLSLMAGVVPFRPSLHRIKCGIHSTHIRRQSQRYQEKCYGVKVMPGVLLSVRKPGRAGDPGSVSKRKIYGHLVRLFVLLGPMLALSAKGAMRNGLLSSDQDQRD